ncbi:Xylose isomerase-like TIM barrel [compost metagenome]
MSIFCRYGEALKFIKDYDPKHLGLVLDYYHCWWDNELICAVHESKEFLGMVHISDWGKSGHDRLDRVIIGDGIIPINTLTQVIHETSYNGVFEIEIMNQKYTNSKNLAETLARDLDLLKDMFPVC